MSQSFRCPNCGAEIAPPAESQTKLRCEACKTESSRRAAGRAAHKAQKRAKSDAEQERAEKRDEEANARNAKRKSEDQKNSYAMLGWGAVFVGVVVAFSIWWTVLGQKRFTGAPILADMNGDGVEDLLVQWDDERLTKESHVIGMIDGKTSRVVWQHTIEDHARSSRAMALGSDYVLVGQSVPVLDILDSKTGALRGTIDLPEIASTVFAHDRQGWVDANGKHVLVDVDQKKGTRQPDSILDPKRPAWAPIDAGTTCPKATCEDVSSLPIPDLHVLEIHFDEGHDDAIVIGRKEDGVHIPMIAGWSRAKKTASWTKTIRTPQEATPQNVVVKHGRAYFEITDGPYRRLLSVGMESGESFWDVKSDENARRADDITVGDDVYVRRGARLEKHDYQTGKLVASLPSRF
jgi:hypothetical protein